MKTHTITVNEAVWSNSKFRTKEWEDRVNIVNWEHNFVERMYYITIKIK